MQFGPKLIWFGFIGAALTAMLRLRTRVGPQPADAGSQRRLDEPLINRPDAPRGAGTVVAVGALSAAVLALGLTWYAVDQNVQQTAIALALTHGDPRGAPTLITRYGCGGCHTITGAPGADGKVGPDLSGLRERVYVGGVLRNTPDNLVQWIVNPQRFSPRSAMPATGITEAEARDVAAYLYQQ